MRYGDEYRHYKGSLYQFLGVAQPLKAGNLTTSTIKRMEKIHSARYHEDTHDVDLYLLDGAYFINSDVPFVIYQSEKDYNTDNAWAREVDDFFTYTEDDHGNLLKRFTLTGKSKEGKDSEALGLG
ncbi:hypothetical protein P8918_12830 [Bacillus spizizenii]|nr:DUF1653 domain-containing protein [Bacillus spizizenii]MCY8890454.1 DUF1653 domain-containing protein [Bacillus spizizenii]MEC0841909.1 hypothetical protein [Bacillus spizizenii]